MREHLKYWTLSSILSSLTRIRHMWQSGFQIRSDIDLSGSVNFSIPNLDTGMDPASRPLSWKFSFYFMIVFNKKWLPFIVMRSNLSLIHSQGCVVRRKLWEFYIYNFFAWYCSVRAFPGFFQKVVELLIRARRTNILCSHPTPIYIPFAP